MGNGDYKTLADVMAEYDAERIAEIERDAHRREAEVRKGPLRGREAYEASLAALPLYDDGTPRPSWDELRPAYQWSWARP